MQHPQSSNSPTSHQRQEKIVAWTLTILLHILVIGGGVFWYFKQNPSDASTNDNPLSTSIQNQVTSEVVAMSSPVPTMPAPLQAEIDPTTAPTTPTPNQTPTLLSPADNKTSTNQITPNKTQNQQNPVNVKTVTVKTDTTSTQTTLPTAVNPELNSKNKTPDNFPVNASTITQTNSQTTQTARGTVTITTTNRTTTVAPEVTQALTDSDIPANERHKLNQQAGKLSANAKAAKKLSPEVENANQATSELIEAVKRNNQAKIDNAE